MWRNPALALLSVILCLALLEIGLRLHGRWLEWRYPETRREDVLWEYDPVLGWRKGALREAFFTSRENRYRSRVRTNHHGLRDEEIPYAPPEGERRVLLLGDSMVVGLEVAREHVIDVQLERLLARHGNHQVVNAGTRGWGTDQSLLFFREEGVRYQPDVVVYAFARNDPENNVTIHRPGRRFGKAYFLPANGSTGAGADAGGGEGEGEAPAPLVLHGVPVPRRFVPHDRWRMSHPEIEALYADHRAAARPPAPAPPSPPSRLVGFVRERLALARRAQVPGRRVELPEALARFRWRVTLGLIREMAEVADSIDARFLVFQTSAYPDLQGQLRRGHSRLAEACRELGIAWTPAFYDPMGRLTRGIHHFRRDGHWNARGHARAAEALYRALRAEAFVGGGSAHKRVPSLPRISASTRRPGAGPASDAKRTGA